MISGLVLIATSFSPSGRDKIKTLLAMIKSKNYSTRTVTQVQEQQQQSASEVVESPNALPIAGENGNKDRVSSSTNEYVVNDKNYVLINGKYYEARADNTYLVNGQKIYFVDSKHKPHAVPRIPTSSNDTVQTARVSDVNTSFQMGDVPTSPNEMVETLKHMQESMQQRNHELENMDFDH